MNLEAHFLNAKHADLKISFRQTGESQSGEAIYILMHGYAGSVLQWKNLVSLLSRNALVVTPNLTHLYMGPKRLTFTEQVEYFQAWLRRNFKDQRINLVALSYGASVAMASAQLAQSSELKIENVFLINPMPVNPQNDLNSWFFRMGLKFKINQRWLYYILSSRLGKRFLHQAAAVFRAQDHSDWERLDHLKGRKMMFVSKIIDQFLWIIRNHDWKDWAQKLGRWSIENKKIQIFMISDQKDPLVTSANYVKLRHVIKAQHNWLNEGIHIPSEQGFKEIYAWLRRKTPRA